MNLFSIADQVRSARGERLRARREKVRARKAHSLRVDAGLFDRLHDIAERGRVVEGLTLFGLAPDKVRRSEESSARVNGVDA